MAILKDKLFSQIQSQFPEHIQARHPQLIEFTKEYYQFMESAQITLTSITDQDQILLETTSEGFLLFNQTDKNGRDEGDRIVDEESAGGEFQKGEIITGSTSGQTATILAEDSDALKLYITSNSKFVTGETITGGTSGATGVIGKYRANPVENINQLLDYTDVSDTLDDFFENFRNTFLNTIPTNLTTGLNKRNFVKNVLQLYQRKGNKKGHEIFFRALLNETPSITYPRDQLLKVSAGIFNTDTTLKATLISPSTSTLINLVGQTITQTAVVGNDKVNTATAVVDAVTTEIIDSQTVGTLALLEDSITGTFVSDTGEVILMEDGDNVVLEEDGTSKILEESIVEFTATDNTDSDVIITGRVHRIIANVNVDSAGSYYTEAQAIPISNQNGGAGANVQISKVGQGTVTKVVVENGGSGYTVGDNLTVTNDNTDGTGFSGKVSVINGGFSLEQDRQENGRIVNEDESVIVMEPATNSNLNDITDIAITNFGVGYKSLPTMVVTSSTGSNATVYGESSTIGSIKGTRVTNTGFRYEASPTFSPQQHIQINNLSGEFTVGETVTSVATDNIILEPTFVEDFKLQLEDFRPSNLLSEEGSTMSTERGLDEGIFTLENTEVSSKKNIRGDAPIEFIRTEDNDIVQGSELRQDADNNLLITGDITFTQLEDSDDNVVLEDSAIDDDLLLEQATTGTLGDKLILEDNLSNGNIVFENLVNRIVQEGQELDNIIDETTTTSTGVVVSFDTSRNILSLSDVVGTFRTGESITGGSSSTTADITLSNQGSVSATIDTTPEDVGAFNGVDGFISESTRLIQDSLIYQDYSYIVKVGESIATWRNDVKRSIHPAGFNLIGQVDIASRVSAKLTGGRTLISGATETDAVVDLFRIIFDEKIGRKLGTTTDGSSLRTNPTRTIQSAASFTANSRAVTLNQDITLSPGQEVEGTVNGVELKQGFVYAGPRLSSINKFAFTAFSHVPADFELDGTDGSSTNAGDNILLEDVLGNRKMIQEDGATDASSGVQISTINNIKLGGSYNTSIDGEATDLADYPLKFKTNFAIPAQVNLK